MAKTKDEESQGQGKQPTLEEQKDKFYEEVEKAQDERPKTTPEMDREAERNKRPYREREEEAVVHPIGYPTGGEAVPGNKTQEQLDNEKLAGKAQSQPPASKTQAELEAEHREQQAKEQEKAAR